MPDRAEWSDTAVTPEAVATLIRGRRTITRFRNDELPDPALVREAIEVARWAPNHHLSEPWRFYLIGEKTKADIIDLNTRLLTATRGVEVARAKRDRWRAIPGWLAVGCVPGEDPVTAREDYAACACAVQNFMLYLRSAGVGSKWSSGAVTREPAFLERLGAEKGEYCIGLIWYGYPENTPRSRRQPLGHCLRSLD